MINFMSDVREWFRALWHWILGPLAPETPDDGDWDE